MRRLGRFQFGVRRLLLLPAIAAFSWWLAIEAVEGQSRWEVVRYHEHEEAAYDSTARRPLPESVPVRPPYEGFFEQDIRRPPSEAELRVERQAREQAARLAAYHHGLSVKYIWAAWLPWFPVAADPPLPD
jgi:hypothetical protein